MPVYSSLPFFRILLPFLGGILLAITMHREVNHPWALALIGVLSAGLLLAGLAKKQYRIAMLLADLFLLGYGYFLTSFTGHQLSADDYRRTASGGDTISMVAALNEVPRYRDKTIRCELRVLSLFDGDTSFRSEGKLLAYFRRSQSASALKPRSVIYLRTVLREVPGPSNPAEFDFREFLEHKHVFHSVFIDSGSFRVIQNVKALNPIWLFGLRLKFEIIRRLTASGLSPQASAICSALLTGYDDEIDKSVVSAFAHSGTLHVLSVSGLHTGLIYLVLNYLFSLLDKKNRFKFIRFLLITCFLWGFALVAGFAAPVLRAVVMFNLLGLGKLFFRPSSSGQLNILLVSAFLLLNIDPWLITNVGFLLSYFAIFGLLYFQPKLAAAWTPTNYFAASAWTSITASLAATLSTLPITLYVFKQFPFWFFVCNIVVVPATFIILVLAVLVLLHLQPAVFLINGLVKLLLWFISFFDSPEFGYAENIPFGWSDAVFLSLLILLVTCAFSRRSFLYSVLSMICLVFWQFAGILQKTEWSESNLFTVYKLRNESGILVKNGDEGMLSVSSSLPVDYSIRPHLVSLGNPRISRFNFTTWNQVKL